jgi:hypothetical protein
MSIWRNAPVLCSLPLARLACVLLTARADVDKISIAQKE